MTMNVYFEYISQLSIKTLKYMQRTLYGERKRDFQKRAFRVFMNVLGIKKKSLESTLYGKAKPYY